MGKKTWMQQALEKVEPTIKERIQEAILKSVDTSKIEKKYNCYNLECVYNLEKRCQSDYFCDNRRENYEPIPINYEEEYNKLKKENEELKNINSDYVTRLNNQGIRIKTDGNQIQKLFMEIDSLKLKATVTEKLEKEINNLNYIIERKDKELDGERKGNTFLENENEEFKRDSRNYEAEIKELKRLHENQRLNIKSEMSENRELKAKVVELERILDKERQETDVIYSETSEERDRLLNENKELKNKISVLKYLEEVQESDSRDKERYRNIEEENKKLRCQYEEARKTAESFEIMCDKYSEKNKTNEAYLIEYENIIKNQKEAIKTLASLL